MNPHGTSVSQEQRPAWGATLPITTADLELERELARRAQNGDLMALRDLLWKNRERLRRIVAIRSGARVCALLEADELHTDAHLLAMRKLGTAELESHAQILQWLTRIAESQLRSKFDYFHGRRRVENAQLRMSAPARDVTEISLASTLTPRDALRLEFERLVDSHVERLEPVVLREALLLRDYFGESWDAVRAQLRLPDIDAARELHRLAHEKLRNRLQPHLAKRKGE